jgi:hypothetical protein
LKRYVVEVMSGDSVKSHQIVTANSPLEAARIGTGPEVHPRRDEVVWIRVTDELDAAVSWFAFKPSGDNNRGFTITPDRP